MTTEMLTIITALAVQFVALVLFFERRISRMEAKLEIFEKKILGQYRRDV